MVIFQHDSVEARSTKAESSSVKSSAVEKRDKGEGPMMATIYTQAHQFESVQAVLFDKDGTLANVEAFLRRLATARSQAIPHQSPAFYSHLAATFGITECGIDPAGLIAVASRQEDLIATAGCIAATGKGWIEACAIAQTAFDQADLSLSPKVSKTPLLEGVIRLISQLSAAGIKIGIVSSDAHSEVTAFIEHYCLPGINWHSGATEGSPLKTHSGFLEFACQSLSVQPSHTLVVGDSASDLALANQGAAGFLGMVGGWTRSPAIGPDIKTVSHLSQISVSSDI
ncbi:MAG: HAD family hydrolase [Cyanobacteria bacterium P01_D01_bin.1]